MAAATAVRAVFTADGAPTVIYPDLEALQRHLASLEGCELRGVRVKGGPRPLLRPLLTLDGAGRFTDRQAARMARRLAQIVQMVPLQGLEPFDSRALSALTDLLATAGAEGVAVHAWAATPYGQARRVAHTLLTHTYQVGSEARLQPLLAKVLTDHGIAAEREVRVGPRERVDILTGHGVAVEVKVAGTPDAVRRQLVRYAASPQVEAIVLATTRQAHRRLPAEIGGKPVVVAWLSGSIG